MNWNSISYILFVLLLGVGLFLKAPLDKTSISIFLIAAAIFFMPFYFASKRGGVPTSTETGLATMWLWFRRLVCWGGALMFAVVGVSVVATEDMSHSFTEKASLLLLSVIMALWLFYLGLVGKRDKFSNMKDDVEHHNENKQRYKWRW